MVGKKSLRFGIDENLAAIKRHSGLHLTKAKPLMIFVGSKKKSIDVDGRIRTEVKGMTWFIDGMRAVLVELLVVFLRDVVLGLEPDCFDGIDPLTVDLEREGHEAGVLGNDPFDRFLLREVFFIFLEVDHDARAPFLFLNV